MGFFSDTKDKNNLGIILKEIIEESGIHRFLVSKPAVFANKTVLEDWKTDPDFFNGTRFGHKPTPFCAILYILIKTNDYVTDPELQQALIDTAVGLYYELRETGIALNGSPADNYVMGMVHGMLND